MAKRNSSTITVSFNNPFEVLLETVSAIKQTGLELFDDAFVSTRTERAKMNKIFSNFNLSNFKFNKKTPLKIILPVALIIVVGVALFSVFNNRPSVQGVATQSIVDADKTVKVNREFKFPLKDDKAKKVGEFTYIVESAELRKQIVVKGQRATAVPGRTFLILNIKIVNGLKSGLQINSRDFVRFEIDGKTNELFAADIHNDPVESQAISTKNTRIGLAIDENAKDIKIQVGEIDGGNNNYTSQFLITSR